MNPRSEIQKGDLVEIITCRYSSWNEIPDHEKQYYEAQREQAPTRGQRFIVAGFTEFPQKKAYAAINGRACLYNASSLNLLSSEKSQQNIKNMSNLESILPC